MDCDLKRVAVDRIDGSDTTFRITTRCDAHALGASIADIGLIQPLVLISRGEKFQVVCGFRRLTACREIGLEKVNARILEDDTDIRRCARIAISENLYQRRLNDIEQARALRLLSDCHSDPADGYRDAKRLGLPDHPDRVRQLLTLLTLPAELQQGVIVGDVATPVAQKLAALDEEEALILGRLLMQLRLGLNRQRDVLTWVADICRRDRIRLSTLLEAPSLAAIVASDEKDGNIRAKAFLSELRRLRFPQLTEAEDEFAQWKQAVGLGQGIQLLPPRYFEGSRYRFTFEFGDQAECRRKIAKLEKISNTSSFQGIFDFSTHGKNRHHD